jgi:hypothetical protein
MYHHVVLFRLKEPADQPRAAAMLRTLEGNIPTLAEIVVGVDDSPEGRSSQLCLITRFADKAAYEAYHIHPFHQRLLGEFVPLVAEARKTDWQV